MAASSIVSLHFFFLFINLSDLQSVIEKATFMLVCVLMHADESDFVIL